MRNYFFRNEPGEIVTVVAGGSLPDFRPKIAGAQSNFERITASPEALAAFLSSLPVLSGPWDDAFHRRYCDACPAEECDGCNKAERNNPLWWLGLAAEADE